MTTNDERALLDRMAVALRRLDDAYCSDPPRTLQQRHEQRKLLIEVRAALAEYDIKRVCSINLG